MTDKSRIEQKKEEKKRGPDDSDSNLIAWIILVFIVGAVLIVGYFTFSPDEVQIASGESFEDLEALESAENPTLVSEGTTVDEADDMVKVVYYGDYGCPFCARYDESEELENLKEEYIETGKAKFVFRVVAFSDGRNSENTALAGRSVWENNPNNYWRWHKTTYQNQGRSNWASWNNIETWTNEIDINGGEIVNDARQTSVYASELENNEQRFRQAGARGTPSLVINGTIVNPLESPDRVKSLIEENQ